MATKRTAPARRTTRLPQSTRARWTQAALTGENRGGGAAPRTPPLVVHEEFEIALPSWDDFGARLARRPARRGIRLSVGGDAVMPDDAEPTPEQRAAYAAIFDCADSVRAAILRALEVSAKVQRRMAAEVPGATLREVIRLTAVHILNPHRDGEAFVGWQFSCGWDDEHGLGVMTHRGQVVEVGGADTAFLNWIARRHGGIDSHAKGTPARTTSGAAAKIAGKKPAAAEKTGRAPGRRKR